MQGYLRTILDGGALTEEEAAGAMTLLMEGAATPAQMGALLAVLRLRGETVEEITGFARVMREKAVRVQTARTPLLDTCGTGGDTVKTFNISTAAAFVAAGAGAAVAKHGNRAVTSKCGSADVLEALGVNLGLAAADVGECVNAVGIGFLFARAHHPAMKHAAPVRAELGVRTVFNVLGPLTNPAGATRQIVGVYSAEWCKPLAQVLGNLGAERALVVHGDGLDEIALWGETDAAELNNGAVTAYRITAKDLGLPECEHKDVAPGADAAENAQILQAVLEGESGARRNLVLANAGAALYIAGLAASSPEGVQIAAAAIDSGAARAKLEELKTWTQERAKNQA